MWPIGRSAPVRPARRLRSQCGGVAEVGAAADGAGARPAVGGGERVGGPLPHVADDVVQADRRWARRRRPARCRPGRRGRRRGTCCSGRAPARRPTGSACARRRGPRTPTRPRWAAAARPGAERRGVGGGDVDDGVVGACLAARAVGMAPARAVHLPPPRRARQRAGRRMVVRQPAGEHERPALALGVRDVAGGRHERREAMVRHRVRLDGERRQRHLPHRALGVAGMAVALVAHEERAAVEDDHRANRPLAGQRLRGVGAWRAVRGAAAAASSAASTRAAAPPRPRRARPAPRPPAARTARSRPVSPASRPGAGAGVQALRVAPRALLDRRVDEHLDERQPGRLVQLAGRPAGPRGTARPATPARPRRRRRTAARRGPRGARSRPATPGRSPRSPDSPWRMLSPSSR